jgi:hypothetical protein
MSIVRQAVTLSLVATLGAHRAEAQCYERQLSGFELTWPRVATAADGRMVVLWTDGTDHVTAVGTDGTVGTTRRLPQVDGWPVQDNSVLASGPDSHLLVAAPYGEAIWTLALSADGQPNGLWSELEDVPNDQYGMVPDVAWDDDSFVLAWTHMFRPADAPTEEHWQMRVARVHADGVGHSAIIDVPGAVSDVAANVRIVRTGSVLWLVWSAAYDDGGDGVIRGMRLAPDLTPLDQAPIAIANASRSPEVANRLRDVASQGDRALVLAAGDPGTDVAAVLDEDGVVGVDSIATPIDPALYWHVELFAVPLGGYQLLETSLPDGAFFPRSAASYRLVDLDADGHPADQAPLLVSGITPAATASHRGTVLVWAVDEGNAERGTSSVRLRLPDGRVLSVNDVVIETLTYEVPCPPPDDGPHCTYDDDGEHNCDYGCSAGGGRAGLTVAGLLLVSAVIAGRRRRSARQRG